jgi:hypothetical protein
MEELIQYYYYELKDVLTRLGYDMKKVPTLHAFQMQVFKKYIYGKMQEDHHIKASCFKPILSTVFTSCILIFPVMVSKDKDADFESLQLRDERAMGFKRRVYQNPRCQNMAKKILPMLDRRGVLDDM